jgi:hypothetical protein
MPTGVYDHKPLTEAHKKNISKSHKGNKYCLGYKQTEEHKKNIGKSNQGKSKPPRTEEHKRNLSLSHKGLGICYYHQNNIPKYDLYVSRLEPIEQCQRNLEDSNILEIKCAYCGRWFIPTITQVRHRIGGIDYDHSKFYCSNDCKQECPIYSIAGRKKYYKGSEGYNSREVQAELRQLAFLRDNYTCQKCESKEHLQCHHINPIKLNPIESADIDNCITLCKGCHKYVHMCIPGCGYAELKDCI